MQAIRRGYWTLLTFALSAVFAGAVPECPVEISPQRAVVKYGDPVTVNCTATQIPRGMGWEATVGSTGMKADVQSVTWNVSSLTDWTAEPKCYGNFLTEPKQCRKNLNISLYKYPDSVSLSPVDQMVEGRQYQLQCEVQNIAPVQYLTLNWYRGQTLIHSQDFFTNTTRTPVNVSATLLITPDRVDNGQPFTCEAELNLGPEGPQPPPAKQSDPLRIAVLYKPRFLISGNERVKIEKGKDLLLSCKTSANPLPTFKWKTPAGVDDNRKEGDQLFQAPAVPGDYECIVENQIGSISKIFSVEKIPDKTVFWSIIGAGIVVIVGLIVGYAFKRYRGNKNSVI
nr:PREDICTED: intercellular adhesion molecule 2-like [Lepisosteus oculatus]